MTVKTLAILGGTGLVGQQVVKEALALNYHLRILARTPSKVSAHPNITVIKGDARDENALNSLVKGVEAVVSTLGPAGMNKSIKTAKLSAKEMPCFNSTQALLPILKKHGIRRFILTSGVSSRVSGDDNNFIMKILLNKIAPALLGDIYIDREKEYQLLAQSDVNWTMARCGAMDTNPPSSSLKTSSTTFQGGKISVQLLARFLLTQVDDQQFIGKGVYLAS
ncbi:NAD(P)-dependent oxidoreductase [Vibrio tapetis]|uniref:NAD(P)-binding domain-containing protein n=1 Tax=Vibrio tapetis subsp. tapetis TaxID=1671868 RepID=A0A2N8ZJ79_9VIBR|nr:NAD(P)H-binding protein [Vibrio tapetis]SON51974.1 conserved protein of unknown function [Vibrio tapetis subsp. tapetis]